jgi:hypothetical protein
VTTAGLDLRRTRVALRDRSIADVLDLAIRFLVAEARSYAKVAVVALVPPALAAIAVSRALGWWWGWAVAVVLATMAEVFFTVLASRLVFEGEVRARDVLRQGLADLPRVAGARVARTLSVAFGLFLLIVVGVWAATISFFVVEVILLERSRLGAAFARSQRIASAAPSDVLICVLVFPIVTALAVLLADVAGRSVMDELLQFDTPPPVWSGKGGALAVLGFFAQVPYVATARFFVYLNVRTRAEGWDIQTRFYAIARRAAPHETA